MNFRLLTLTIVLCSFSLVSSHIIRKRSPRLAQVIPGGGENFGGIEGGYGLPTNIANMQAIASGGEGSTIIASGSSDAGSSSINSSGGIGVKPFGGGDEGQNIANQNTAAFSGLGNTGLLEGLSHGSGRGTRDVVKSSVNEALTGTGETEANLDVHRLTDGHDDEKKIVQRDDIGGGRSIQPVILALPDLGAAAGGVSTAGGGGFRASSSNVATSHNFAVSTIH